MFCDWHVSHWDWLRKEYGANKSPYRSNKWSKKLLPHRQPWRSENKSTFLLYFIPRSIYFYGLFHSVVSSFQQEMFTSAFSFFFVFSIFFSSFMAITQECCVQSWKSPGSNTPQDTNCTATCPLSRKLFKLDEPDMQDTAGEAEMNS